MDTIHPVPLHTNTKKIAKNQSFRVRRAFTGQVSANTHNKPSTIPTMRERRIAGMIERLFSLDNQCGTRALLQFYELFGEKSESEKNA